MKHVGLTGGIGSGKSTVVKIFESLGVPVYVADTRSKELLNSNLKLREILINTFGSIYKGDRIDTHLFASIIFNDDGKRKLANEIIHPFVGEDFSMWLKKQKTNYIIKEAAILFELGSYKQFDKNILITSPIVLRKERLLKRGGISISEIEARIKSQWTDDEKVKLANYHIKNDGNHSLISQVLQIHKELTSL